MVWIAVDLDGTEGIYKCEQDTDIPTRNQETKQWNYTPYGGSWIQLLKGTIKKLIGRELTWNDEPVELKEE